MKEKYEREYIEIIRFSEKDVIATSVPDGEEDELPFIKATE